MSERCEALFLFVLLWVPIHRKLRRRIKLLMSKCLVWYIPNTPHLKPYCMDIVTGFLQGWFKGCAAFFRSIREYNLEPHAYRHLFQSTRKGGTS